MQEAIDLLRAEKEAHNTGLVGGLGAKTSEPDSGSNVQIMTRKLVNTLTRAKNVVERLSEQLALATAKN